MRKTARVHVGEKVFDVINYSLMFVILVVTLYPMWHVLCSSVSDPYLLVANRGLTLLPRGFDLSSYSRVFNNQSIGIGYLNTIFVVCIGTCVNLVMSIMAAYVLTRKGLVARIFLTRMIVFTMYFSGGTIPTFLVIQELGLYGSRWALILPTAINTWNMIILRTNFAGFPEELEDAARIDGAGEMTFLMRILLPLSKSILSVMVLFYAVSHWNSWLPACLYLRDRAKYPLQLVLREILISSDMSTMSSDVDMMDDYAVAMTIKYATIVVSSAPILCIYPFVQKYFVKGVMVGALKG